MDNPVSRLTSFGKGWLDRIESTLLETTVLSGKVPSPFEFGAIAATQFAPKDKATTPTVVARDSVFDVQEARERIREFLDGTFKPKRFPELMQYLSKRMLRLEFRRSGEGNSVNYLVDTKSKRSVPASLVDSRLTQAGLRKTFGESYKVAPKAVESLTDEQKLAQKLRRENARQLRFGDADAVQFDGWEDIGFAAPSLFGGREISLQGHDVWVGVVHARASEDPAENLKMIREAKANGVKLVLPALTREDAVVGKFIAGMPVLVRDSAVRTRFIDPSLSYQSLSTAFGKTPQEHYGELRTRGQRAPTQDKSTVVNLSEFRAQFSRKPGAATAVETVVAPAPVPSVQKQNAEPSVRYTIRHQVGADGREEMHVIDPRTGAPAPMAVLALGVGTYAKEDGFGLPVGTLKIDEGKRLHHFDEQGRLHNAYGAAIVPPRGSEEPKTYALEGREVRASAFVQERNEAFASQMSSYQEVEAGADVEDRDQHAYQR